MSSMGKIDVTSNNEEEIALVHDSVKRVHVQLAADGSGAFAPSGERAAAVRAARPMRWPSRRGPGARCAAAIATTARRRMLLRLGAIAVTVDRESLSLCLLTE